MNIGNNNELLTIAENAPIGICILDAATLVTEMVNSRFVEVAGKPLEAIYNKSYRDIFAGAAFYDEAGLAGVVKDGITYRTGETELMLIRNGHEEEVHVTFVYEPVKDEEGKVVKVAVWVLENIQLVKARNQIRQLNEELAATSKDAKTTSEELSASNEKLIQAEAQWHELNNELEEQVTERTEQLAATNEELRASNEELFQAQHTLQQYNNELEGHIETRTREVKASENRFRSLIEQIPAAINVFLTQDLIVDLPNQRMLEIWGRTFEEVNGKPLEAGMPELKGQPFMQKLRDVIATGIPYSSAAEKAFIQRNGILEELYFDIVYQPVVNEDGTITSCVQIASDVTEAVTSQRKIEALNNELAATNEELSAANEELAAATEEQVEANQRLADAIQQSEMQRERLNTFFMQAPAGICILNGPDLEYELINPGYQKMLPGRDLLGRPLFEALPELVGTPLQQVLLDVFKKGEPATFTELLIPLAKPEGNGLEDRYFTLHYLPRRNETGQTDGILTFVYEVTEQVISRQKVERAEERLRIATESADLGTWSYYAASNKLITSARFKEIFGISPDERLSHEDKMSLIHSDYQPIVTAALQAAFDGGDPLYLEYPLTIEGKDGRQKWVRAVGKRVQDDGSGVYITGVVADITEQKRDEQRKNDFIGMVSHEMKTPLTSLNGYLQLLQMRTGSDDALANNMLGKATKQINRMTILINGFLNVSRLESGKIQIDKQRFDMALLVKEAEEETLSTISSHKVIFHPVETTWVNADRDKISQVINNLISNAVKYSSAGTVINVACVTIDGNAVVSIKDEGIGIKKEDQPKLFDRYFRVSNDNATSASGFGIGLYLCAEIIQRHDGKIWVESEEGKGSTFFFSLPVVA